MKGFESAEGMLMGGRADKCVVAFGHVLLVCYVFFLLVVDLDVNGALVAAISSSCYRFEWLRL